MRLPALLQYAASHHGSDLHLTVGHPPMMRVDGELRPIKGEDVLDERNVKALVVEMLREGQQQRLATEQNLDLALQVEDQRFRANVHYEQGHLAFTARVINKKIPSFAEIGFLPIGEQLLQVRNGLILVTGPAGTGKSTTLAAMIQTINASRAAHVVTLEDPIEFVFPLDKAIVEQREIGADVASFAFGLRQVVRQDPDVIMVGEMRDFESIATTVTLAETGHLVLATLHTASSAETIQRIIDIFPAAQQAQIRAQLSSSLRAVISQVLVPAVAGGRVAAREILLNNSAVANLIREGKVEQIANVMSTGAKAGMQSLKQDLSRLIREKVISKEAAQYFTPSFL